MSKLKVAITTGDIDGIGLEVAAKALNEIGPQKGVQFFVFRAEKSRPKYVRLIQQSFKTKQVSSLSDALNINNCHLVEIVSPQSPATWVEQSAQACLTNKLSAIATGPMSKSGVLAAGLNDMGHTDILKRVCKATTVNMAFIGECFNVFLATGHVPLKDVPTAINIRQLKAALLNADNFRRSLPQKNRKKPIAVLGLNPHAGEEGLIGTEELTVFKNLKKFALINHIPIEGPLVPDAAFQKQHWNKFSVYFALYHDQGLIPFKLVHGQETGVHISVGLPIIRTSVDHGTAKDIFKRDIANPNSMRDAIILAIKLARLKRT